MTFGPSMISLPFGNVEHIVQLVVARDAYHRVIKVVHQITFVVPRQFQLSIISKVC